MPQCNALTNHMCVTLTGSWRPCCRFNKFNFVDIEPIDFESYRQTDFYQNIIQDMSNGWSEGCEKCMKEEERGQTSLRLVINSFTSGGPDVEYIEISLSNQCNLACRMCSPSYSTFWHKIIRENPQLKQYHHTKAQPEINVEKIFSTVDLTKLKKIKYLGGEPFITPEIKHLFQYLEDKGIIQNIVLECNTNCTLFPEKWLHYLDKFEKVIMELSIDGIGVVNDYIRYGKTWDIIEPNIVKWCNYSKNSNTRVDMFSTIQAYNLHDMQNIKNYSNMLGINHFGSLLVTPDFLSTNVLPEDYLLEIKDNYNSQYYKSISNNNQFDKFCEYTYNMDSVFGLHLKNVVPELYKYME